MRTFLNFAFAVGHQEVHRAYPRHAPRDYFFKGFYADRIDGRMYQKRPIYRLFSSKMGDKKKRGCFEVLVYMYRIESDTLSVLHADYAVPYIDKIG